MNRPSNTNAPSERPLREGADKPHEVYSTRLTSSLQPFFTFLDYGSNSCYVSRSLAAKLQPYDTRLPAKLSGVAGTKGPNVDQDVVIRFSWKLPNGWSLPYEISCGVIDDNAFPGDLVIGRSTFHALKLGFHDDGSITLNGHPGEPCIQRVSPNHPRHPRHQKKSVHFTSDDTYATSEEVVHQLRNVDPKYHDIINGWNKEFPGVFDEKLRKTSEKATVMHRIETGDNPPMKTPPRRFSPAQEAALREFCQSYDGVIIQKSKSPWASQALLTPKKNPDGSPKTKFNKEKGHDEIVWRFCCDFRPVNSKTKKHAHPLPNADAEIERAAGHKYYCFLDLLNGFWHIRMHPRDREKAAFVTPFGIFEWLVMPFGLCNAPATFQAFVEEVLGPLREFLAGLLDDIAIWGDTMEELIERVHKVLERLNEYGLVLNIPKCRWFVPEGTFLGFIISEEGIRADPTKVAAIRERREPTTATEVRGFVQAAGYLRRLIDHFSSKVGPLYDLIGGPKHQKITLTSDQRLAWETIRDAITTTPVIVKFQYSLPCILETDSSQEDVGAAVYQPRMTANGKSVLHPVAYFSKRLTQTQQRYGAQERELLAIVLALQHWRYWLEGGDVTVRTDHESLKLFRTKADQPPRIIRFLDVIEHFGVTILVRKGPTNVMADWLSRPPKEEQLTIKPMHSEFNSYVLRTEESVLAAGEEATEEPDGEEEPQPQADVQQVTRIDHLNRIDLQAIFEYLLLNHDLPERLSAPWVRKNFALHDDALHRIQPPIQGVPGIPDQRAVVMLKVPEYEDLLQESFRTHERLGHASVGTTLRDLGARFWHPEIILTAHEAVRTCKQCQLMQRPDPTLGSLTPITPARPLTRWAIDFTGPLFTMPLLNAIEYSTGWLVSQFTTGETFQHTVPLCTFIKNQFGAPREMISDNAGAFKSDEALEWHRSNGTTIRPVTAARPRGNGKVEQANGKIKAIAIKMAMDQPGRTAQDYLERAVYVYNRLKGPNGYSPYFLMYGTEPRDDPQQIYHHSPYERDPTPEEEAQWAEELVRTNGAPIARSWALSLKASRDKTRAYLQEKKGLIRTFSTGDWVLRVRQRSNKTEPFYDGPWAIASCHPGNTYLLRSPGGIENERLYNGDHLFPAYTSDGHPVRSFWYAAPRLLQQDRRRLADAVGGLED